MKTELELSTLARDENQPARQQDLFPTFGETFIFNHAGRIIQDPKIAIIELVANCWDAGATKVEINWPEKEHGIFSVIDNGTLYGKFI